MKRIEDDSFIDTLNISDRIKKKLVKKGLCLPPFLAITPTYLLKAMGIEDNIAKEIISVSKRLIGFEVITHEDFIEKWPKIRRISTGSTELDRILDEGIQTMKLYEFFGPAGSGKTQLCTQLSINVQLDEGRGGIRGKVIYIDTERGFNAGRILEICNRRGINGKKILKGIFYASVSSLTELFRLMDRSKELILKEKVKLMIVDDIITPFHANLRKEIAEKALIRLNKFVYHLVDLAIDNNLAVIITNKVYSFPDQIAGEKIYPFGGIPLESAVHVKVLLKKKEGNIFQAQVIDGETKAAYFAIDESGVLDIEKRT